MIAIYSEILSPRLDYIIDFFFRSKDLDVEVFNDVEGFKVSGLKKINYSANKMADVHNILPSGVLFESDIDNNLKLEKRGENLYLRDVSDPFSVAFYLLSRYEEYQPHTKDAHGRFGAQQSQQKQLDILYRPIVDELVKETWASLGISFDSELAKFDCVPSFDIDVAWAYKGRPVWRTAGGFFKGDIGSRLKVILKRKKDPYDTYSEIVNISTQVDRIICFTLLSDWGKYDKNIHWENNEYQSLIRGLNANGGMGIHPGYESHLQPDKLEIEIDRLAQIVGHEVTKSRFHFLRFELPKSYEILLEKGIIKDYSMGYADDVGFRAGTSIPFYFFNLNKNEKTNLLVFPFAYMDSAFKDNLKKTPEEAKTMVDEMMKLVANVGGLFMCIWHNSSITDDGEWLGWKGVLNYTVKRKNELK